MPGDRDDSYGEPMRESPREPLQPTAEQRAAWREMGREKFRDSEHQRYAQSHRTAESLRDAGRHGYQATADRYGREFASDLLASHRRAQPTRPEREMVGLLKELGAEEGRDYQREYKVSPGMYADFAIPERKLAIDDRAHRARDPRDRDDSEDDPVANIPDRTLAPEDRELLADALREIARDLKPEQVQAFILRYFPGWPIEGDDPPTISGHFNVTPRTVRSLLGSRTGARRRCGKWTPRAAAPGGKKRLCGSKSSTGWVAVIVARRPCRSVVTPAPSVPAMRWV